MVRVYPIDAAGNCETGTLAGEADFEELCTSTFECATSVDVELPSLRNPSGYCWSVTEFSTDGTESSTVESRFAYIMPALGYRDPGVQLGAAEARDPDPLPGDSYDQDTVTFSWDPSPGPVLGYMVRVGNYPWPSTRAQPPGGLSTTTTAIPRLRTRRIRRNSRPSRRSRLTEEVRRTRAYLLDRLGGARGSRAAR